jgi:hypothetical protein
MCGTLDVRLLAGTTYLHVETFSAMAAIKSEYVGFEVLKVVSTKMAVSGL